jgi:hypothetical protein
MLIGSFTIYNVGFVDRGRELLRSDNQFTWENYSIRIPSRTVRRQASATDGREVRKLAGYQRTRSSILHTICGRAHSTVKRRIKFFYFGGDYKDQRRELRYRSTLPSKPVTLLSQSGATTLFFETLAMLVPDEMSSARLLILDPRIRKVCETKWTRSVSRRESCR